jgi:DNA-binding response OmpR family regulator
MTCPHCAPVGLTFTDDPPQAHYNGTALSLTAGQLRILRRLARTGRATFQHLHSSPEVLRVQIHHMRKRLPPGLRIGVIMGWGYQLELD